MYFKVVTILIVQLNSVFLHIVETQFGKIEGEERKNDDGTSLYVFLGIPYAVQPVGELKFKDPVPLTEPYPNKYVQATKTTRCVQFSPTVNKVIGQEDCLHLNIYTTKLDKNANYDVIFFIHGGAFRDGAGHAQTPEYIFEYNKNIVFVSINYRLGPFGFLSTDTSVLPGNMGLKDQVVALKWVKSNIKQFGGNPENIVLAGASSGGTSVHWHYMSPMSRNLFSKGISIGGDGLNRLLKAKNFREGIEKLKNVFPECAECAEDDDDTKTISCLSKKPSVEILQTFLSKVTGHPSDVIMYYFRPVVEISSANSFLDEHPFHILWSRRVKNAPFLISTTSGEGIAWAQRFLIDYRKRSELNNNWNVMAPTLFDFTDIAEKEELTKISEQIWNHYIRGTITYNNRDGLIKAFGDRLIANSIENSVRLHSAASTANTYLYYFDYKGSQSFEQLFLKTDKVIGVGHCSDLFYILKMKRFNLPDKDKPIKEMMVNMWSSFIKHGTPATGTLSLWPPVSRTITYGGNIDYILIDKTPRLMSKPEISGGIFWDSLKLDELRLSGRLYVPKYIENLKKPRINGPLQKIFPNFPNLFEGWLYVE